MRYRKLFKNLTWYQSLVRNPKSTPVVRSCRRLFEVVSVLWSSSQSRLRVRGSLWFVGRIFSHHQQLEISFRPCFVATQFWSFWFANSVPLVRERHHRASDSGCDRLPPSSTAIATHLAIVFSYRDSVLSFESSLVRN